MTDADPLLVPCPRCGRPVLPETSGPMRVWICEPCNKGEAGRGTVGGRGGQGVFKGQMQVGDGVWVDLR